jgi:copper chaperone
MIELDVPDMTCGHCAATIRKAVSATDPGASCEVDLGAKRVRVMSARQPADFLAALEEAGYPSTLVRAVG